MIKATVEKKNDGISNEVSMNGTLDTLAFECASLIAAVVTEIDGLPLPAQRMLCFAICQQANDFIKENSK